MTRLEKYRRAGGSAVVLLTQPLSRMFQRHTQRQGRRPTVPCPGSPSNARKHSPDRRKTMRKSETQKAQEKISVGALLLTIVIANVWVFAYLAPYA
jgi:hypothetical protein